jgi:tryptophan-rich sensory protein
MGLNTIWTPVFSGAENLEAALYYIVALWLSIVSYVVVAWKVNRTASLMFIPYLAWVSFASLLNYNYWLLN